MSKIIIFSILCIGLSFSVPVLGSETDEFVLRNGITFKDSFQDILEKETFPIEKVKEPSDQDNVNGGTIVTEAGTVAGIPDTVVRYDINDDGILRGMTYDFPETDNADDIVAYYKHLYEGLINKYGSHMDIPEGDTYAITTNAFLNANMTITFAEIEYGEGSSDYLGYSEWVVENGNDHVKIDLVSYYVQKSNTDVQFYLDLAYRSFTDEDLAKEMQNISDEKDKIYSDL